mmetsp:Transcript_21697/g.42627  ORF Transcript_21697/g.42627 Transcript_21697/m.42627 type:complete len:407 (+) Transcript_21697:1008-2228(+)|eukprot:CAMPEP_0171513482 /NCGR_PEP_ID=MMETSP0959-20130129/2252_1 /TAXON_ID=87120 /ORGANISM="Aurantiochytrium limacinum, Strain ATCCMYA-1381" /LENGTH=406 /DNA_ID=CAMNT_0012051579 /DNA_START=843 /DNA_END=2063 /DNA_ORIENTATION=+
MRILFYSCLVLLVLYIGRCEYKFWSTIVSSEQSARYALSGLHGSQDSVVLLGDADPEGYLNLRHLAYTHRPTQPHGKQIKTNQREDWCKPIDVIYNWNPLYVDDEPVPPAPFDASDPPAWWTLEQLAKVHGRYLILIAAGDHSTHALASDPWWSLPNVDLAVAYYGNNPDIADFYKSNAKYFKQAHGIKWQVYRELIPSIDLESYEYIWLPDDDVEMRSKDVDLMLRLAAAFDIRLGQPSINPEQSHYAHLRVKRGVAMHHVNFVEIMAPFFRMDAFLYILPTIMNDHTRCGWGLDWLWVHLLRFPPIASIDVTPANHVGSISTMRSGSLYEKFNVQPYRELDLTLRMFGCQPFNKRDLDHDVDMVSAKMQLSRYEKRIAATRIALTHREPSSYPEAAEILEFQET